MVATPVATSSPVAEDVPKPISKTKKSLIPSINEISSILSQQKKEEIRVIEGVENQEFGLNELLSVWHQYADDLKKDRKSNLFHMMTAHPPQLYGTAITILLDNAVLEKYFIDEKVNLTNYLRKSLKNYAIQVSAEVVKIETQKRIYTNAEKISHLAALNPKMKDLIQRFNLES